MAIKNVMVVDDSPTDAHVISDINMVSLFPRHQVVKRQWPNPRQKNLT